MGIKALDYIDGIFWTINPYVWSEKLWHGEKAVASLWNQDYPTKFNIYNTFIMYYIIIIITWATVKMSAF